jgi:AcrR family transcriptional regulator
MTEDTGLPASYEMVWGVRDRPTKGPKRGLSLEQVVDAGIRVATADGVDGVSMSRVANELGTSAMSLYRYVASKDELLTLMVDGAFGLVEVEEPTEGTWRERLAEWSRIELGAYRQFPWITRIPVTGAPIMPHQVRFMEWGLRALGDTKLAEHEKLSTILLITSFTRSFAMLSSDLTAAFTSNPDTVAQVMSNYGALLKMLTKAEEYPAVHALVDSGTFDDEEDEFDGLDYDYNFGLDRILDGIEALVRRRE